MTSVLFKVSVLLLLIYGEYSGAQAMLPLGDDEALMANTGVANLGSVGNVVYNPAGLAFAKDVGAAGGLNTFAILQSDNDGNNLKYQTASIVPSLLTSIRRHRFGTSAVAVISDGIVDIQKKWAVQIPNALPVNAYINIHVDMIKGGVLHGFNLNKDLGLGLSLMVTRYYYNFSISSYQKNGNDTSLAVTHSAISVYGFTPTVGAAYRLSEKVDLGFRMDVPFIKFRSSGETNSYAVSYLNGANTASAFEETFSPNFGTPLVFTVGAKFNLSSRLFFLTDFIHTLPATYNDRDDRSSSRVTSTAAYGFKTGLSVPISENLDLLSGLHYALNQSVINSLDSPKVRELFVTSGIRVIPWDMDFGLFFSSATTTLTAVQSDNRAFGLTLASSRLIK